MNPTVDGTKAGSQVAVFDFKPKAYITFLNDSDQFEFSVIPKCHFYFGNGIESLSGTNIMPAISLGAGFSSDLNKWAIRPEIGIEQFFITF